MKLYKTYDKNSEFKPVWTSSAGDASKAKTDMKKALKDLDVTHTGVVAESVEIDVRKEGLLAFLNGK